MIRVAIIYILYNTDIKLLNNSIKSLEGSIPDNLDITFFLYNNSSIDIKQKIIINEKFKYFYDGENVGLAKAQNKIIKDNKNLFDYFLTSDQDSIYSQKYLEIGIDFMEKNKGCGCVVPVWRNLLSENQNFESQIVLKDNKLKLVSPVDVIEDFFSITHAICSGSLIRVNMFDQIGLFNDDFFIDWIDNEWMWRGHKLGLNLICNKNLQLIHQWGESPIRFMNIEIPKKSNLRVYYTFRNGLALIFQKDLESYFKKYLIKQLTKYLLLIFLSFNYKKYKSLFKAIIDSKKIDVTTIKR
jgi:rhamnosyltransferase